MNEIDLSNIPVEPTVEILDPNGNVLLTTNNVTTFTYVRMEIKKNHLSGYSVRNSNGKIIPIDSKGRISDWDNLTGEKHEQFLISLLSP